MASKNSAWIPRSFAPRSFIAKMEKKLIDRYISGDIIKKLSSGSKIVAVFGARQVGKTTLVEQIIGVLRTRIFRANADEIKYRDVFESQNLDTMKSLVSGYDLLFIDEAQRIENIGINLKILHEGIKNLKIIVTGSSSFELANKIKEPLTGRMWTYTLFPLSFLELSKTKNTFALRQLLDSVLVYGEYPGVFTLESNEEKRKLLKELTVSYLYKDILQLESIKYANKIAKLLKLLAFQIGNEVSLNELAGSLEMSRATVERYIDLLEKSFVLFRLSSFSGNKRKDVVKKDKIYFYDTGIRNALIENFEALPERNDVGGLFENFLIAERVKRNAYEETGAHGYFWRTYGGGEVDYIEESSSGISAYEFKYKKNSSRRPRSFLAEYPEAKFTLINRENCLPFVLQ